MTTTGSPTVGGHFDGRAASVAATYAAVLAAARRFGKEVGRELRGWLERAYSLAGDDRTGMWMLNYAAGAAPRSSSPPG